MRFLGRGWRALLLVLSLAGLEACGGGGGATDSSPSNPSGGDLHLLSANLRDQALAVPSSPNFLFIFDTEVAPEGLAAFVSMTDSQGNVPLTVDVIVGSLRVRAAQGFRLRTDHTLTIRAGLRASNGALLREDIVRHFRTVLFEGNNVVVQPGNFSLTNYTGEHTFRIADVNGDDRPDIVQIGGDAALLPGERNSFAVNVFLQNADHSFTRSQNLLVHEGQLRSSNAMGDMAIVDLDHDGRPEILVSIQRPLPGLNGLLVLKQDALGRYAPDGFLATNFAYKLFVADINRDGKPDVLAIGQGLAMTDGPDRCGMVAVLSSAAGAQLQPSTVLTCERYEAALGSLDQTGALHLVLIRNTFTRPPEALTPRMRIYRLDAQGQPTLDSALMNAATSVGAGLSDCNGVMLIDVNGDGAKDLMFRNCMVDDRTSTSVIYTSNAGAAYVEWTRQSFGAYAYLVADMDRDGLEDVMVVVQDSTTGSFIGGGFALSTGGFEISHLEPVDAFDTMSQATTAVADLDGDGLPDIVLDSYNTGLSVLFQRKR
jgi:hypothetical protein